MCAVLLSVGFYQHLQNFKLKLEIDRYKELYALSTSINEQKEELFYNMRDKYRKWKVEHEDMRAQNYILTRKFRKTDTKEYRDYLSSLIKESGVGGDKVAKKKKNSNIEYKEYEQEYGDMYHLVLDRPTDSDSSIKFVNDTDYPKFVGIQGGPLFFNWDKEFRVAREYVIMYPKVYVKKSEPFNGKEKLTRCYIQ